MDGVSKAYAWQESIELSKELLRICEEFSDADTNVMVWHLRQAIVDIPATIASDLKRKRGATMDPVIKLATEMELIHRIYPAIDTGRAPEQLKKLMERMESDDFDEAEEEPKEREEVQPAGGTVVSPKVGTSNAPVRRTLTIKNEDDVVTSIQPKN